MKILLRNFQSGTQRRMIFRIKRAKSAVCSGATGEQLELFDQKGVADGGKAENGLVLYPF